jgi:hypothetical protein
VSEPVQHHTIVPSAIIPPAPLVPAEERRVVGYERYAGILVPVYEAPPVPVQQQAVVVRRGLDPVAQRLAGTGVAAAGVGWGIGQAVGSFAGISSGSLAWILLALLAVRLGGGPRRVTHTTHITTNNRGWLSHSHTRKG